MFNRIFTKSALLAGSSAMALSVAVAGAAQSQDSADEADDDVEEIVVTGIRSSIKSSIAKKRDNASLVEAISAEDIGKLPDASIGESLARLPGLTAQRFDGRANKISIRGLAPDYTATSLNGREMVSSDNNRGVEFDQFPAELLIGATVYKTPDASLVTQAVGGTVDLQTIKPLAHGERTIVVGVRGEMGTSGGRNPGVSNKGYRTNFAYVDQNEEGTLGWALGYARMVQPISEQHIHYWGFPEIGDNGGAGWTDVNGDTVDPTAGILGGLKPYVKSNRLTRDGLMGVLEVAQSDTVRHRVDAFYSKFNDEQTLRGAEIPLFWDGSPQITDGSLVVTDGLVTSADWTNVYPMLRNDFKDRDVKTYAFGWNSQWDATDTLSVELDASYSKAERYYASSEMYMSNGRGRTGQAYELGYILEGENGISLDSNMDLTDGGGWQLGDNLGWGGPLCTPELGWQCSTQDLYRNIEESSDDLTAIKLAAEQQFEGAVKSVEFGARYSVRNKDHLADGQWAVLQAHADGEASTVPIPAEYQTSPTSLDFIGLGDLVSFDPQALWDSGIYTTPITHQFDAANFEAATWSVKEEVVNLWAQANFETEKVTGNFGLQAVHTDQSSVGGVVSAEGNPPVLTVAEVEYGTSYWKFLPSLNASYHINSTNKIRLGAARIMARPNMDAMNASRSFGFDQSRRTSTDVNESPWSGGGGNPTLEPWMSWQFDLAYENYFADGAYVALGAFYKKLDSWVYNENQILSFEGFPAPPATDENPGEIALYEGLVWSPQNGEGGKIYGVEFSYSLPFEVLSESLEGFGLTGSASLTRSEVRERPEDEPFQMPGLSREVINSTLYYEKHGFQARVSLRHRSSYLSETFGLSQSREYRETKPETILDAQVSMDLDDYGIEGATVYLQGSNLTNEPFITYENGNPAQYRNYHTYGRSFMLGFSYKM